MLWDYQRHRGWALRRADEGMRWDFLGRGWYADEIRHVLPVSALLSDWMDEQVLTQNRTVIEFGNRPDCR